MAINRANGGIIGKRNITSGGGNVVNTFTASGVHSVQPSTTEVDLLVIAGGGGGGAQGGGGGAGGFQNLTDQQVVPGDQIAVTVGAGGVGGYFGGPVPASDITPTSGANSVYANPISPITSTGGGRGGGRQSSGGLAAATGGSGGGGGSAGASPGATDAAAGTSGQGNSGGAGIGSDNVGGAGGGGAGAAGTSVPPGNGDGGNSTNQANFGQRGGTGAPSTITGTSTMYAGGGGGSGGTGVSTLYYSGGAGGDGGGGHGKSGSESPGIALAGAVNTGSGGGSSTQPGNKASNAAKSEAGGSGLVVVKEKDKANGVFNMNSQMVSNSKGQWPTQGRYELSNSVMFNQADADELTITPSSGDRQKFTYAGWFKRSTPGNREAMLRTGGSGDTQIFEFIFHQNHYIMLGLASVNVIETNALYRDPTAWYHVVLAVDTTQAIAADRVKLFVNGKDTYYDGGWNVTNLPSQNALYGIGRGGVEHTIGASDSGGDPFDGYMSDIYFIDGQQLHCGNFAMPNPDNTNIWIPKPYRGTFGSNGYHLEFKQSGTSQNASGIGADTSGNNNHFAVNNLATTSQSTDNPSNNFCTLSSIDMNGRTSSLFTLSEGNTKAAFSQSASNFGQQFGTMGVQSGKWYYEVKYTYGNAGQFGWFDNGDRNNVSGSADLFTEAGEGDFTGLAFRIDTSNNIKEVGASQQADSGMDASSGDIIGIAFDADNGKLYGFKNGTEITGQDISAETSLLSAKTITDYMIPFISAGDGGSGTKTGTFEVNFGNPSFSISSGNADANGHGNFEYAPPSGYFALCSKNVGLTG